MKMDTKIIVFIVAVVQMVSSAIVPPTIQASNGVFSGVQLPDVDMYLGIPYAEPPVGDLRFKKPQPPSSQEGIYAANTKTPPCSQRSNSEEPGEKPSEDCLYLNLWIPRNDVPEDSTSSKAILVWIYPGAFFGGSMNEDMYDGRTLAAEGDVIVASMNYRLGLFGFLFGGGDDAPGNVGLLDQIAALKWIKENARAFGGDPDRITLFGESSGALSVGMHLMSPLSEGLFTRGLMQGRSPLYRYSKESPNTGIELTDEFAQTVECSDSSQSMSTNPDAVLACLRGKDAEDLVRAEGEFSRKSTGRFFPRYGDEVLPKSPAEAMNAGEFKEADLLAGANSNEGALTFYSILPEIYNSSEVPRITKEQAKEHIKMAFRSSTNPSPDEVASAYIDKIEEEDYESLVQAVFDSVSDARVVCPTLFFAEAYAQNRNSVYFYWFDHHPSNSPRPEWMRMAHYEDVQFVFGLPVRKPEEYTPEEKDLSLSVIKNWAAFAKTGDPNYVSSSYWPEYNIEDPAYAWIKTDRREIGHGPHLDSCQFWRRFYLLT